MEAAPVVKVFDALDGWKEQAVRVGQVWWSEHNLHGDMRAHIGNALQVDEIDVRRAKLRMMELTPRTGVVARDVSFDSMRYMKLIGDAGVPRRGIWYQSRSGKKMYPEDFRLGDFDIESIANGSAQIPRYGGQAPEPYSVAQHSVLVSMLIVDFLPPDTSEMDRLWAQYDAFCHDFSEGVGLNEMIHGVKELLPDYKRLEEQVMRLLSAQFRFRWPMAPETKRADHAVLAAEATVLFPVNERPEPWMFGAADDEVLERLGLKAYPAVWPFREAKARFIARYKELRTQLGFAD